MSTLRFTPGTPAPEFRAPSNHGQTLDQDSFRGKVPLLLVFPGGDPEESRAILIAFDTRLVEFGHRRVQVLAVVRETAREVRELSERLPLRSLTVLADSDGAIATSFGADTRPRSVLVDRAGAIFRVLARDPRGDTVEHTLSACDALVGPPAIR